MPSTLEKITTALADIKNMNAAIKRTEELRSKDHDKLLETQGVIDNGLVPRISKLERAREKQDDLKLLQSWRMWLIILGMLPGVVSMVIQIIKMVGDKS